MDLSGGSLSILDMVRKMKHKSRPLVARMRYLDPELHKLVFPSMVDPDAVGELQQAESELAMLTHKIVGDCEIELVDFTDAAG